MTSYMYRCIIVIIMAGDDGYDYANDDEDDALSGFGETTANFAMAYVAAIYHNDCQCVVIIRNVPRARFFPTDEILL